MEITTYFVSKLLGLKAFGNVKVILSLNLCNRDFLKSGTLSYITSDKYVSSITDNDNIVAVLIEENIYENHRASLSHITCIISDRPEADFYKIHEYLVQENLFYTEYNFKTVVGANLKLGNNVFIDTEGVIIGDNVIIDSNSIIKKGTKIDNNCYVGCNVLVGCDGFQLVRCRTGNNSLVTHVGGVDIKKNVSIGNGSVISKSLFTDVTYIGENTKIDNLVHVSHNCVIGENCVITAGTILAGSVILKDRVWIGPNSTIYNKVICKENSTIGIGSVVLNNVEENSKVFGNPSRKIQ
jgi:UDP-3-O-[3-hydroxymyristoyl] glucosamine N-acyltransferase